MNADQSLTPEQHEKMEELTPSQIEHLREKSRTDLYFLSKVVLGYNQVEEKAHGALCAFMVQEKRDRRMVLMPRGHLKTTICTISDSIRLALKDPNTRILIQNEVFENAADILFELKGHWERGDMLRALFPELIPERLFGPGTDWARDASSIKRSANYKESTWTASGSGGSPQSKHFNFIKNDDLIGEKHKESENEMQRAIRWADAMEPLLDSPNDTLDYYGTRKTMADVYNHIMEQLGDKLAVFIREPIENGSAIFSKFPLEKLLDIMVNKPEVWAHDFMNNPIGKGGLDWGKGLLRQFEISRNRVVFVDHITEQLASWHLDELDIVVTADPNSGKLLGTDKAAVVVHGVSPSEQIFVLESWSDRVQPDGFIDKLFSLCMKWQPRIVGIEEAGQQNQLYYFEKRCNLEQTFFHIKPLLHNNMDKERRIRGGLDVPMKARRVYLQAHQVVLIGQVQLFPQLQVHNKDEIDAFAYGPQLYQAGVSAKDLAEAEEAERIAEELRGLTGYGASV
jgi:hypothetical protein